ncbi:hypothetical protein OE88DRAFT_1715646 [Heliocybe sulcata]|uniref:Deoxycytidylate deaminase n=1 Tax=Heliocybe sulcata TaxID=5364 RepID=A0A5C3NH62_9AGAM|nr:hypothetical protein OE88DRAFT_1715646 [Heliocybe sulcata]
MLIAIVGTRCSGKTTVEDYLRHKGFTLVSIQPNTSLTECAQRNNLRLDTDGGRESTKTETSGHRSVQGQITGKTLPYVPPHSTEPTPGALCFPNAAALLDHVTRNWRITFVTSDLTDRRTLDQFSTKPFFLLVSIDAPLMDRYERYNLRTNGAHSLEDFVAENDAHVYGHTTGKSILHAPASLHEVRHMIDLQIVNSFASVAAFETHLDALDLLDPNRLRPDWDTYFMTLASLASQRSNCMKRRVGAILVRDKRIVATGYNGTPRGITNCNEGGCPRCNSGQEALDECLCLHAEENALLEAGRERVGQGAVLYCNTCPCLKCTIKIIQTGVKEVIYNLSYKVDDASAKLFQEAGIKLRRHAPPP